MALFAALVSIVLCAVSPSPSAAQNGAHAEDGYTVGKTYFSAHRYADAIAVLNDYIAAHPRDPRAIVLRGDAQANLGRNQAALADYDTAIGIEPSYEYAYVTRCETRLQLDDVAGALSDCNAAIRLDAVDALAYEDRGDVRFAQEQYGAAADDYDRAISLGRSTAYLFAARCDAERLVGRRDAATSDCAKALTLDPASRRGLWSSGRLALTEGRWSDGAASLTQYITQQPQASTTAYYFRGLAYNRMSRYGDALADLRTYVGREPNDPDGLRERGIAEFGTGDLASARADLAAAAAGYRKSGDAGQADKTDAMLRSVNAGRSPLP